VFKACQLLGVHSLEQAVIACFKAGWIDIDDAGLSFVVVDEATILRDLLEQLVEAVRHRNERELTKPQKAYLDAFDDHLYARGDEERAVTRAQMDQTLAAVLDAAPARRDRTRDLVELLVTFMTETDR
jgi:hypothetical protein